MKLPLYQCHKRVRACKIERVHHAYGADTSEDQCWITPEDPWYIAPGDPGLDPIQVCNEYVQKHQPKVGGYYVVYADGYESFSPAEVFESGYSLVSEDAGLPVATA